MATSSTSMAVTCTGLQGDELLQRLKTALTSPRQHLFIQSFWTSLQCDEERDMVIDLDEACKFIDTTKWNAKRTLLKHFLEGEHFQVDSFAYQFDKQNERDGRGGHNAERILMTPDTFKELCMLSSTAKGREVRTYYIKMEKVLKAYLVDRAIAAAKDKAQLQQQLEDCAARLLAEKTAAEEKLRKLRQKTYEEAPKFDKVYIAKEAAELHSDRHKIGMTIDTKKREAQLNTGSAQGVRIVYERPTHNAKLIENIVESVMRRYHYGKEHYQNRVEHSINVIDVATTVVDTLASCYEHIERKAMIKHVMTGLDALSVKCESIDSDPGSDSDSDTDDGILASDSRLPRMVECEFHAHLNLPYEHQFMKQSVLQMRERHVTAGGPGVWRVKADELYVQFKNWLEDIDARGRFDMTAIKFGFRIAKLVWNDAKRTGFKGILKTRHGTGMVYFVDVESVVGEMASRRWLDPSELDKWLACAGATAPPSSV